MNAFLQWNLQTFNLMLQFSNRLQLAGISIYFFDKIITRPPTIKCISFIFQKFKMQKLDQSFQSYRIFPVSKLFNGTRMFSSIPTIRIGSSPRSLTIFMSAIAFIGFEAANFTNWNLSKSIDESSLFLVLQTYYWKYQESHFSL